MRRDSNIPTGGQACPNVSEDAGPLLQWPVAPTTVRLEPGQLHIWAAALNEFVSQAPILGSLLSPAEQARAEKFKFLEHRNHYLVRHGLLRLILSRYLQQHPSAIHFQHGPKGKPELRRKENSLPLFFNTSHSAEITVCAVTSACPIGVDVERTRQIPDIEGIARRFFLPRETQTLMALSPESRLQAFYVCWVRKEAFLKATGEGISAGLARVEVTVAPHEKPMVVSIAGEQRVHEQWQLHPFSPAPGYVGCVAYRNAPLVLSQWRQAEIAT